MLAAFTLATTRSEAAIPPTENLLPADTFFLVTTPDYATLRKELGDSPQMLMWNDPALRPFHDRVMGKWNELFVGPLENDLGVDLGTFADLPQGQLTVAMTRNGWDGIDDTKSLGWLLLLDAKSHSDSLKTNLAVLKKKWAAAGKSIRTETIHGIEFSIVPLSTNDIPPTISGLLPSKPPVQEAGVTPKAKESLNIVIAQYDSLLIVGSSIQAVEPVAVHLTGGSTPSLADNSQFETDKASQFRDGTLYYSWLNARDLFAVVAHIPAPEPNPDAPTMFPVPSAAAVLNASGLSGLKSVSLSYHQAHDGITTTLYLSAPESTRAGLLKMLVAPQKDASPPVFVPADAVSYWRWRMDSQKFWTELQKSVAMISPAYATSLNGAIEMANRMVEQKNPGFDLRKNLLGNLGDDWLSYNKLPARGGADPGSIRNVFLFAAVNPEQVLAAIQSTVALYAPQEGAPAPQDFMGHTIYGLAMRPQVSTTGATAAGALYYTIGSGYIAMSSDISMLQEFIRSAGKPPKPLAAVPGLADAAQHIGGMNGGLFGYQDNRAEMRAFFTSLKQSANPAGATPPISLILPKSFADMLDFSLLPDYDQVAKYFYLSVFNGSATADGITFKGFYPRPPQLN